MPSDALTYFHTAKEFSKVLAGGKIERIGMPTKEEVVLFVKPKGEKKPRALLLSVSSSSSRIALVNNGGENPLSAFSFLMHLRKHVGGGTINEIDTVLRERIFRIYIQSFDELGYKKQYVLYAEMMGRYSNLVLVDERGIITDCLKHISLDASQKHAVLPGLTYSYPPAPENKISPDDANGVTALLQRFEGGKLADYLMGGIFGYAPSSMRELVFRAYGSLTPDENAVKNSPKAFLDEIKKADEEYSPCIKVDGDKVSDFFHRQYKSIEGELKCVSTIIEGQNLYYAQRVTTTVGSAKTDKLILAVKNAIKKNEKSLAILRERILESSDFEEDKILGELITANIYKIKQGMKEVEVDDYYNGNTRKITLDETLSPQKNAQKYYKSYNKKKTAIEKSNEIIAITEDKNEYFETILSALTSAEGDESVIAEIAVELENAGIIKKSSVKKKRKPSLPRILTVDGYTVKIGRNNLQNDNLVRNSEGGWLWLHTQKIHGSHAIIEGTNIPQDTINKVASYAAFYSKANMSANVPVDYTLVKFVKKPSGAPLGKVIYTRQQTVNVTPQKP